MALLYRNLIGATTILAFFLSLGVGSASARGKAEDKGEAAEAATQAAVVRPSCDRRRMDRSDRSSL